MAEKYEGTVSLHGKEYPVKIVDGERFINNQRILDFVADHPEVLLDMTILGSRIITGELGEDADFQTEADLLYIAGGN